MANRDNFKSDSQDIHTRILHLEKGEFADSIFLNIFNLAPVPYCLNDNNGNVLALNKRFIQTFGYDLTDIPTLNAWWPKAYPDPRYRESVIAQWQKHMEKAEQMNTEFEPMEVKIHCKNSTERVVVASAAPLTTSSADIHLVVLYDITDIYRANTKIDDLSSSLTSVSVALAQTDLALQLEKEKVFANEERLRLAMQGANDGLWDWDLAKGEIYFSPRWKSMLGYPEHEIKDSVEAWEELVHPDDLSEAQAHIEGFLARRSDKYTTEFRMRHKEGHSVHILSQAFAVESEQGIITRLVGTHVDITERKNAEAQLNYQSSHDSLTSLINRREFKRRTEILLLKAKSEGALHAMCYIDLDQFKVVNDTCGHAAGDELLRQLGVLLHDLVKPSDTLARLGGDEFGILMEDCLLDSASSTAMSILRAIQDFQFAWEHRSFRIGASMGLVAITEQTPDFNELLRDADAACYMAKDKGRNCIHVHHDEDKELAERQGELEWVTLIHQAFEKNQFCLFAQAIESLDRPNERHYELLLRMIDHEGKAIPPGAFLPAAERYNLMRRLDRWVVSESLSILKDNAEFLENIHFISINLSGQSLTDESFQDFVLNELEAIGAFASKICFEITETAAISNLAVATKFVSSLKQRGCKFALDDFGSGLSSFGYLKTLAVDYLKIDGIFVKDIADDPIDHAMVKSINDIGQVMGMKTVAEFVENDVIKEKLRNVGVDYVQGYGVHIPQPFKDLI